jgi:hypothetical protein
MKGMIQRARESEWRNRKIATNGQNVMTEPNESIGRQKRIESESNMTNK